MATTMTKLTTREKDAALARWREQVAQVAQAGDAFKVAIHALALLHGELHDPKNADALGLDYALPTRLLGAFRGADTVFMGAVEPQTVHADGWYEGWRKQCIERGWLDQ